MEMASQGNLDEFLKLVGEYIPDATRRMIARDICRALHAMHSIGVAHEDVEPENIILDYGLRAKLCDFGSSIQEQSTRFLKVSGTEQYWSPEKKKFINNTKKFADETNDFTHEKYTTEGGYDRLKSDIYSLGLILERLKVPIYRECKVDDPLKRPDCSKILQHIGNRTFDYEHDRLTDFISEAEMIHFACKWNDCCDCCRCLTEGRKLMCKAQYADALKKLEACTCEESGVPKILSALMYMYGLGTKADVKAARELIGRVKEMEEYQDPAIYHPKEDFIEFLAVAVKGGEAGEDEVERILMILAGKGNPLAQNALSSMWERSARLGSGTWTSERNQMLSEMESHERHYRNNSLKYLYRAATSGFAFSQAALSCLYLFHNHAAIAYYHHGNDMRLPKIERQFLRQAAEAGSLLAHLMEGIADNSLEEEALIRSKRIDIFTFLAHIYKLIGNIRNAVKWLEVGASMDDVECLHKLGVLLSDKARLEGALNQGYQLSAYHLALLLQKENREIDALACVAYYLLQEETRECDALATASVSHQSPLVPDDIVEPLLRLEENSKDFKDTWHGLISTLEKRLSGINLAYVGELYRKKGLLERATHWYRLACNQGYYAAAASLGFIQDKHTETLKWWNAGAEKGCVICLFNLHSNCSDRNLALEYLEKGKDLKDPTLTYEYARRRLGDGDKEEGLRYLRKSIEYGYEDAALLMAIEFKHDRRDLEYWMGRYLKNIDAKNVCVLGARVHREDALALLIGLPVDPNPEAFWRLGAYFMLTGQEEKAYYWFSKGAFKREPQCSKLYGRLLLLVGYPLVAMHFLLPVFPRGYACHCEILSSLQLQKQKLKGWIVALIMERQGLVALTTADQGNDVELNSVEFFRSQVRGLPNVGAREEMLLQYLSSTPEEKEEAVAAGFLLGESAQTSIACMYIISMIFANVNKSESKRWLCKALESDTELSIEVPPWRADTGSQVSSRVAPTGIEETQVVFDEDEALETLAQNFSNEPCMITNTVSSIVSTASRPYFAAAEMQKPESSGKNIRGLMVSVFLKEAGGADASKVQQGMPMFEIEVRFKGSPIRDATMGRKGWFLHVRKVCTRYTLLIPRRSFATGDDADDDNILSQVQVIVSKYSGAAPPVARVQVDEVSLCSPSLSRVLSYLKESWETELSSMQRSLEISFTAKKSHLIWNRSNNSTKAT